MCQSCLCPFLGSERLRRTTHPFSRIVTISATRVRSRRDLFEPIASFRRWSRLPRNQRRGHGGHLQPVQPGSEAFRRPRSRNNDSCVRPPRTRRDRSRGWLEPAGVASRSDAVRPPAEPSPPRRHPAGDSPSIMNRFTRIAVCLAGAILWGAGPRRARADDYAFYPRERDGHLAGAAGPGRGRGGRATGRGPRAPPDRSPEPRSSAATTRRASSADGSREPSGPRRRSRPSSSRSCRRPTPGGRGPAGPSIRGSRPSRGSGPPAPGRTDCRPTGSWRARGH